MKEFPNCRFLETVTGSSETYRTGTFVNSSDNTSHRLPSSNNTGLRADVTLRELGGKKNWSLTLNGVIAYTSSVSYQAKTTLPGLDKDAFDYSAFMADFWGNADGDRFYGGLSGFGESRTRSFNPYAGFTLKYNQDHYFISLEANTQGRIARYSLDPSINMNTLDTKITARGSYTTKHEFEFNTDISYVFYKGYAAG